MLDDASELIGPYFGNAERRSGEGAARLREPSNGDRPRTPTAANAELMALSVTEHGSEVPPAEGALSGATSWRLGRHVVATRAPSAAVGAKFRWATDSRSAIV